MTGFKLVDGIPNPSMLISRYTYGILVFNTTFTNISVWWWRKLECPQKIAYNYLPQLN